MKLTAVCLGIAMLAPVACSGPAKQETTVESAEPDEEEEQEATVARRVGSSHSPMSGQLSERLPDAGPTEMTPERMEQLMERFVDGGTLGSVSDVIAGCEGADAGCVDPAFQGLGGIGDSPAGAEPDED